MTFDEGYNYCSSNRQAKFPGTTGFDYGRLAVFQTPDIYQCLIQAAWKWTAAHTIMIGAHNRNGTSNVLTDFLWARTSSTDDGCNIANATGKVFGNAVGNGSMVLVADAAQWDLTAHDQLSAMPVFCEFGKERCG